MLSITLNSLLDGLNGISEHSPHYKARHFDGETLNPTVFSLKSLKTLSQSLHPPFEMSEL